jgi:hypothetical protein
MANRYAFIPAANWRPGFIANSSALTARLVEHYGGFGGMPAGVLAHYVRMGSNYTIKMPADEEGAKAVVSALETALKGAEDAARMADQLARSKPDPEQRMQQPMPERAREPMPEELAAEENSHADRALAFYNFMHSRGAVRADHAVRELLMNPEHGFYAAQVNLASDRPEITTPLLRSQGYALSLAQALGHMAAWYEGREMQHDGPIVIAETGSGSGALARAFMQLNTEHRWWWIGQERSMRYICVEPNAKHRKALAQIPGVEVVEGTAQLTGLPSGSVDVLIDHEVLDCLPYRSVHYDPKARKISQEAFVTLNAHGKAQVEFRNAERDKELAAFETYLSISRNGDRYRTFSPEYWAYWEESQRVLRDGGKRVAIDYVPMFGSIGNKAEDLGMALFRPYKNDITHAIDFGFQSKLAKEHGFGTVQVGDILDFMTMHNSPPRMGLMEGMGWMFMMATKGGQEMEARGYGESGNYGGASRVGTW